MADAAPAPPVPANDDSESGFEREEMYKEILAGTVKAHVGHLFLCHKDPESWPSEVTSADGDLLPRAFAAALKSRKKDIGKNYAFTVCSGSDAKLESEWGSDWAGFTDGDLLAFPAMLRYRNLTPENVDEFVETVLVNENRWNGKVEPLGGDYVFVCAHGSRDKRCGVCGPVLVKRFEEEIEARGLGHEVFVKPCSHVGGHKYAGNVIIYSHDQDDMIAGHWYGYVTPDDVPALIDQHIGKREIIYRLWRGEVGKSVEEQKEAYEKAVAEREKELSRNVSGTSQNGTEENLKMNGDLTEIEEGTSSCCQGAKGITCCRDSAIEDVVGSLPKDGKKSGHGNKVKAWLNSWDKSDTFMALGIIGLAASVAVAYSFYRKSVSK